MDATYTIQRALHLHGNGSGVKSRSEEITSGDCQVEWNEFQNSSDICAMCFTPNRNSDNLTVTFTINISYAQTTTGKYWCAGIYDAEPQSLKVSSPGEGLYYSFGLNGGRYGDKEQTFTFHGNFRAGVTYWLVVGMARFTTQNTGTLRSPANIELKATNVSGATAYIWTSQEAGEETFSQTVNAGNTFRSLEGYQSSAFVKSYTTGIGGQNIIGIGMNENTGSRLYFNAGCIPVSGVSRPLRSVKISFPVLYNGTGTHNYRWTISTTPPGASSPYINTLSEVNEPGQIASGTFHDYSGSRNEHTFFADIPANTDFYIYLWSHGTEDGVKRYGNFHIQGDISITLTAEAQSGMGWVAFNPFVWQNGAWSEMTCNIYKNGSWEA